MKILVPTQDPWPSRSYRAYANLFRKNGLITIPQGVTSILLDSMGRRCLAVIQANGGHTVLGFMTNVLETVT